MLAGKWQGCSPGLLNSSASRRLAWAEQRVRYGLAPRLLPDPRLPLPIRRAASLQAFADERAGNASAPVEEEGDVMQQEWPDCLAEDLLVDVEGCSLVSPASCG